MRQAGEAIGAVGGGEEVVERKWVFDSSFAGVKDGKVGDRQSRVRKLGSYCLLMTLRW